MRCVRDVCIMSVFMESTPFACDRTTKCQILFLYICRANICYCENSCQIIAATIYEVVVSVSMCHFMFGVAIYCMTKNRKAFIVLVFRVNHGSISHGDFTALSLSEYILWRIGWMEIIRALIMIFQVTYKCTWKWNNWHSSKAHAIKSFRA